MNREIPIIRDAYVDTSFGTGALKVTPAHDPNDFEIGNRHKLDFVNIMHPDGRMNTNAGEFAERDRFEAREAARARQMAAVDQRLTRFESLTQQLDEQEAGLEKLASDAAEGEHAHII